MKLPLIVKSVPIAEFEIRNGQYRGVLHTDIEAAGVTQYLHVLMVCRGDEERPFVVVAAEISNLTKGLEDIPFFCAFTDEGHHNFGIQPQHRDVNFFLQVAFEVADEWIQEIEQ